MTERATGERRIAELRNYEDLVVAIGGMVSERQISLSDLDELSGLAAEAAPARWCNGRCRRPARDLRSFGLGKTLIQLEVLRLILARPAATC
jgi:hypothetical protein